MIPPDTPNERPAAKTKAEKKKPDLAEDQRRELELLTSLLKQEEQRIADQRKMLDWFADAYQCLASQPRSSWWLPETKRLERQRERLKDARLFDAEAYLRRYPDVAAAGRDPLDHFMRHGIREGRIALDPGGEQTSD